MVGAESLGYGKIQIINKIISEHWGLEPTQATFTYQELLYVIQEMNKGGGAQYLLDQSKNRGYAKFRSFVKMLLYRNLADYDSMVLITAPKGTGKSSTGLMLAKEWCKLIGKKFDPEKNVVYRNAQLVNALDTLEPFSPIVCDEAVNFCSSSEWAKAENKELKKKLATVRTKHFFFILCFPMKIQKVEKTYLDSFVNYWIELPYRGQAVLFARDSNPVTDAWRLKEFDSVGNYNEFTSDEMILKSLQKHPNYWDNFKVPRPSKKFYDRYYEVRQRNTVAYDDPDLLANLSQQEIHRAFLLKELEYIMQTDMSAGMSVVLKDIKLKFNVTITKQQLEMLMRDANEIIKKVQEKAIEIS